MRVNLYLHPMALLTIEAQVPEASKISFTDWPVRQTRFFNSSLCEFRGKLYLASRHFCEDHLRGRVTVAQVNDKMAVQKHWRPKLFEPTEYHHEEDPRLFVHNGHLWMVYVHVYRYNPGNYSCSQVLVRFDRNMRVDRTLVPEIGVNGGSGQEKNWVPLSHEGKLFIIYNLKTAETFEIYDADGAIISSNKPNKPFVWPYGSFSGGTPPVMVHGKLIAAQHSFSPVYPQRVYSMSFMELDSKPPFAIKRISRRPVIVGSSSNGYIQDRLMGRWMPRCIFPCGMVERDGRLLVSAGVNDSFTYLIPFDTKQVLDGMVSMRTFAKKSMRYYKTAAAPKVPSGASFTALVKYWKTVTRNIGYPVYPNRKVFIFCTDNPSIQAKAFADCEAVTEIHEDEFTLSREGVEVKE